MSVSTIRPQATWTARLAWALLLLFAGAALAIWGLSRWNAGARFLGITPPPPITAPPMTAPRLTAAPAAATRLPSVAEAGRIATLEARLLRLERQTLSVQGSAGRADALVIAFAARRAIDRGVALGYLEPLLVERFGANHHAAVATVVTASRNPVTQAELTADYDKLGPILRGIGPDEDW